MTVEEYLERHIRQVHAVIEQMCEASLQGGEHGVLILYKPGGDVEVSVSPDVPYGHIHERHDGVYVKVRDLPRAATVRFEDEP
jgi:hypothetical protein